MIDKKQFPSCVKLQYILAMKYSRQRKLELLNSKLVEQPYDLSNMDEDERDAYIAHQHVSHFPDNKHHNKVIDGMTVNIGTDHDWSDSGYKERRKTNIEGGAWVEKSELNTTKSLEIRQWQ